MSFLGHIAVGVATARAITPDASPSGVLEGRMLGLAALAMLPDVDLIVREVAPTVGLFDHRGASHSIFVAMLAGALVAVAVRARGGRRPIWWGVLAAGVVASHPLMDMLGDSNLGVELLWPVSDARFLAPWQFLPNPMLANPFGAGLRDLALEVLIFMPAWIFAIRPRNIRDVRPDT